MNETPDFFSDLGGTLVANQNNLSASVRDRTAQLATALDAGNYSPLNTGNGRSVSDVTEKSSGFRYPQFGGETFNPKLDEARLVGQLLRVRELMRDGLWRSLSEIAEKAECSEASASARLRDLRKARFGLYTVDRKRIGPGLFSYRLGGRGI